MRGWADFPDLPSEVTQFTDGALAYARRMAETRYRNPQFATDGTELRILPDRDAKFMVSVLGQGCASGGKQGTNPERIRVLRDEIALPVWMAFIQGSGGDTTVWSTWLHMAPPAVPISLMTGAHRSGWKVSDLTSARVLAFPEAIPVKPVEGLF